jgi:hypothetical protein
MSQLFAAMQPTENPELGLFHSRRELTTYVNEHLLRNMTLENHEGLSPVGLLVIEMSGVAEVYIQPYLMKVMKSAMYTWDELAPAILQVMVRWNQEPAVAAGELVEPREVMRDVARGDFNPPEAGELVSGVA